MFDYFESDEKIEGAIAERQRLARTLDETHALAAVSRPRVAHSLRRDIGTGNGSRAHQLSRAVARAAAGIENARSFAQFRCEMPGEAVACQMLIEQIGVHQFGD